MVNMRSVNYIHVVVFILSLLTVACTSNDIDKYKDNGLIPGDTSTAAEVVRAAKVANEKRDEESVGDALDELAEWLITTSPIWLPIFLVF